MNLLGTTIKSLQEKRIPTIHEFFEEGFPLTSDDRFSQFDISISPWARVLCDWFDDPLVEWIFLIFGSQLAKTSFMMGTFLYAAQYYMGAVPVLWALNTEDSAKEFIKTRFRVFLENSSQEEILKKSQWKQEYFRVYNASVKVGYATTKDSLRTKPCRLVYGDEIGRWKETVDYIKKRTRTFEGKRKGVFATTPPDDQNHHSVKAYQAGNFYQFHVQCPHCSTPQALLFSNIRFTGKKGNGWDYNEVRNSAYYMCSFCQNKIEEAHKAAMIQTGKAVCVDPVTFKPIEEKATSTRTLQLSSLYSVFTKWGTLAVDFLHAKDKGVEALKVFYTDELAEIFKRLGKTIKQDRLKAYVDQGRSKGFLLGYDAYTAGIDLQRSGKAYYTILGFIAGNFRADILDFGEIPWRIIKDDLVLTDWSGVLDVFSNSAEYHKIVLDSSDGMVSQAVYDFCIAQGKPFFPLKDQANQYSKIRYERVGLSPGSHFKQKRQQGQLFLSIQSDFFKDDLENVFSRDPKCENIWTFPRETEDTEYFTHINNEHRTEVYKNGKRRSTWQPKYHGAPQHYFSSLIYACAAVEDIRIKLMKGPIQKPLDLEKIEVKKL